MTAYDTPAAAYIAQQRRRATDALILWLASTGQLATDTDTHDAHNRQQATKAPAEDAHI